jgi:hypothetical protein
MRSQSIDNCRGSKCHANCGALQQPERQARSREREVGHERERDEADGTAGCAAARHLELPDLGERAPHVPALYDCGDDPYAADQLAILSVAPVEHCMTKSRSDYRFGA